MYKRIVSLFLSLLVIFSVTIPAHATETSDNSYTDSTGTIYFSNSTEEILTSSEAAEYDIYEVHFPVSYSERSMPTNATKESILDECEFVSETVIGTYQIFTYSSDTLHKYLHNCSIITDISLLNNYLYIFYTTTTGEEIILCYDENGIYNKVVYFPESDYSVCDIGGFSFAHSNFRAGTTYVTSDDLIDEIMALLSDNDLETLASMDNIQIEYIDNGNVIVNPVITIPSNTRASSTCGFTNEAALLADLKRDFPYQTQANVVNSTLYSDLLQKNLTIKVSSFRDSYVRKSVNLISFAVGTALSQIASNIGVSSVSSVSTILSALGIAVSVYNTISEAVQLANSAIYQYRAGIQGRVYDTVTWNDYVLVNSYASSKCEFSGGYDSSDVFTWIKSYTPSTIQRTAAQMASEAKSWYETHVYYDGECTLYYPYP